MKASQFIIGPPIKTKHLFFRFPFFFCFLLCQRQFKNHSFLIQEDRSSELESQKSNCGLIHPGQNWPILRTGWRSLIGLAVPIMTQPCSSGVYTWVTCTDTVLEERQRTSAWTLSKYSAGELNVIWEEPHKRTKGVLWSDFSCRW